MSELLLLHGMKIIYFGTGAETKQDTGLTTFGKQYIQKMNEMKMLIDVSHSSPKTFWDTIKLSQAPVIATHSCSDHLCHHPRNLSDEQIKEIASRNGIIGICYCATFLSENGMATVQDVVKHICYIANLVGTDYVGLGSDFDGLDEEEQTEGAKKISDIPNLIQELKKAGFYEQEIEKIMGKNWIRVLKENME